MPTRSSAGVTDMKKLTFEAKECIGCHLCEQVCAAYHEGYINPGKARLRIDCFYDLLQNSDSPLQLVVRGRVCNMCLKCVEICGPKALKVTDGRLVLDVEKCNLCGLCRDKCPERVVVSDGAKIRICDLCEGHPRCVEWCPRGALRLVEVG